jgi:hypothetical protein
MDTNVLTDKNEVPTDTQLRAVLGKCAKQWDQVVAATDEAGGCRAEWKYYGTSGWLRKAMQKKRNLYFVIPRAGRFIVAFTLGQKAVAAVVASQASRRTKDALVASRKYAEGQSVKIDSRERAFLKDFQTLLEIKVQN